MDELVRMRMLVGENAVERLIQSKVAVFGLGGVGAACVEALARGGIGSFFLVDHDEVSLSNINRQIIALHSTIGQKKTKVMKARIWDIRPQTEVITKEVFALPENMQELITQDIDYIVDAVDTVTAKLALAQIASEKKIPLISCMGTGNKLHPEMLQIADIYETSVCPLCKVMRKELKRYGVERLKVVYSKEMPLEPNENTTEDKGNRRSLPGSVSFVPPAAGMILAGQVIRDLAEDRRR